VIPMMNRLRFWHKFKTLLCFRRAIASTLLLSGMLGNYCVNAAQLINTLPAPLSKNWTVCAHFESKAADCNTQTLPVPLESLPKEVKHQTYSKDFILSSNLRKQNLSLWIADLDDVDEVYVNDQLIGKTGGFLPQLESGFRYSRLYSIPGEHLFFNQFNRLQIKTYSSRYLSSLRYSEPTIGGFQYFKKNIENENTLLAIAASLLLMLTIFQVFYFVVIKDNYEALYFAFFLVGFAFISLARTHWPLDFALDLSAIYKLEIFMLVFSLIAIALFVFHFYELEIRRIDIIGFYVLGIAGLVIIVWPNSSEFRLVSQLNYLLSLAIIFLIIGNALFEAIRNQQKYATVVTLTFITLGLVLLFDAMMHAPEFFQTNLAMRTQILPITVAITGITLSLTLTYKYWDFFKGSTYDHLTGTLLRPAFFQRLSEEMQRCQRGESQLLVAIIDIQQVKNLSANYGYNISNHLLLVVSNSLTKVLRPFDLICRFSDEQFSIAALLTKKEDAQTCLKRIYQELVSIQQPINQEIELYIDARVGGVLYHEDQHLTVSQLLQDANYAVSKTKNQPSKNYVLFQNQTSAVR